MTPRFGRILLLVPFALSCSAWLFSFAVFHNASNSDLEGDYYIVGFFGALSFIGTGPLTGLMLSLLMRAERVAFLKFAGLFWFIALPVLSFETLALGTSIFPLPFFVGNGPATVAIHVEMIRAAVEAVVWYAIHLAVLYPIVKRGVAATAKGAALLVVSSSVFIGLGFVLVFFRSLAPPGAYW